MRRLLVVSGSRADWGLLAPVIAELRQRSAFEVRLAVTGQHLSAGTASLQAIAADGIPIDYRVDMGLTADDRPAALAQAMGLGIAGMGGVLDSYRPDLMVVLGDRYEILCAVMAAVVAVVPVAHLCGGDVTAGAIDDSIRHAITKLSSLHFVSNDLAANRVRQMGEPGERVHQVGSPGLDRIYQCLPVSKEALLADVGLSEYQRVLMVTCHPVTLASDPLMDSRAVLAALERFPELGLIISGSNADTGGSEIDAEMARFAAAHDNVVFHQSLGTRRYFSALSHVSAVVGNSSSGLYEAPSFKVPTVNVGDRQQGRLKAVSVIDCAPSADAIAQAIRDALALDCSDAVNPYGDGHTAVRIADVLETIVEFSALTQKAFVDMHA